METGAVRHKPRSERPSPFEKDIQRIGQSFSQNPRKSICTASVELPLHQDQQFIKFSRKFESLCVQNSIVASNKSQMTYRIEKNLLLKILKKVEENGHFLNRICFSDKATKSKLMLATIEFCTHKSSNFLWKTL